jgi:excisionase family DNA binding protein
MSFPASLSPVAVNACVDSCEELNVPNHAARKVDFLRHCRWVEYLGGRGDVAVRLLSVLEAAQLLTVSVDTVYGLCAAKQLRHERLGLRRGRIRIPVEAIDEYLQRVAVGVEEAVKPPPAAPLKLRHVSL